MVFTYLEGWLSQASSYKKDEQNTSSLMDNFFKKQDKGLAAEYPIHQ